MEFDHSPRAADYIQRVRDFIRDRVLPAEREYYAHLAEPGQTWTQPPIMETLKAEAKREGLWNLFLPEEEYGPGLSTLEYAPLAEEMGWSFIAPEVFNCNAPDTGNMEVLARYGSREQQDAWLKPLLAGEIRSAFAMTEKDIASSDATNMQATIVVEGDEVVVNGRKWWTSNAGHPRCEFFIFMGVTDPEADRHQRHSMVIVPRNTPGVKVKRMLPVFGQLDEPYGHGEVHFENARVPLGNVIAGPGRGFEIAQGRLGPGRIHHCMRAIGAAERALQLMCERSLSRVAFGKPLAKLGGNADIIANARMDIEMARLLTLQAAYKIDKYGVFAAMSEISQIKVVAPSLCQRIVDQAIQMHGGAGVSDDFPLTALFGYARVLRLADGPDEVHRALIAKYELKKYQR
ncbi:acyl-CoA dehydrogenase [Hahella sp. KA22]|uniref:acyl-CoA dehydrogenase family protein n=1 Tax=Hahella sp. KA22 TaxID=1628392 RepID=UPI000FDF648A|nr:acyl-CoA dehydrogenase family protein [Hahella sp. KA22]AZZ95031.1 acyl-CoA dehydrogenase [Hahella sp. KA22]QAY52676.1 acyl-CoA dehydrogenase [Hahella sp. KA22]